MSRILAVAMILLACASSILAQTPQPTSAAVGARAPAEGGRPEFLLSPTSQLYMRWDGIAAHNEVYKKSMWGGVMAGPTGDSIRSMVAKAPKLLGNNLVSNPLLEGKDPKELKATLDDLKNASRLIDIVVDRGVIFAAEVREPRPTLKGVGEAIGGLIGGKIPGPENLIPDIHLLAIVPEIAGKEAEFNAAARLLLKRQNMKSTPFALLGRTGFQLTLPEGSPLAAAWWMEGKHFMVYVGTMKLEAILTEMTANVAKGGVTAHPLFNRCAKNPGYESITRGFVDAEKIVKVAKTLAGPFVPGLSQRLDDLGFGNLKAIVFNSGFDGKESRASYDFDLPGERKGLARVLKQQPLTLQDLPPMPPDVSRFSALRIDPDAVYESAIFALEALQLGEQFDSEEKAKTPAEKLRLRRDAVAKEYDKLLGISIKEELLPYLGDKVVMFQSPTEGLTVFGTVVCVSLKEPARVQALSDRAHRSLERIFGGTIKVRKKTMKGVEIRELYSKDFGFLTPCYAIVGDWLVVSVHPQCIQGLILRTKGDLPSWKPDAATLARLKTMPSDGCGLQFCDPRSTAQNLCCIAPLALGTLALQNRFMETENDYNPIDIGMLPNSHELSRHLFPNLTVTRDDGKTVHIEVNESFSLPLEAIGFEVFAFTGLIALFN